MRALCLHAKVFLLKPQWFHNSVWQSQTFYPKFWVLISPVQAEKSKVFGFLLLRFPLEVLGSVALRAALWASRVNTWSEPCQPETSPLCSRSWLGFAKECIVGEDKRAAPCQDSQEVLPKGGSVTAGGTEIKLGINCLKHRLEFGQSWGPPGIAYWEKIEKNSILFTADKEVHCPGNVFSLAPLGPVAAVAVQGRG